MGDLQWLDDLNAEVALGDLGPYDPDARSRFYVRSNFPPPDIDIQQWRLHIDGDVASPTSLTLDQLKAIGEVRSVVTMECAGNGRKAMNPVPEGTPWGYGAIGVGEFTGVPLASVLERCRPGSEVVEFVFTGLDYGTVEPEGGIPYQFGLGVEAAAASNALLAWELDRRPLPAAHGYPLRLVVPGDYGMRSVKWLSRITASPERFDGHFPLKYRYFGDPSVPDGERVGAMRIRSLITAPGDASHISGEVEVRGLAWSGADPVVGVSTSVDDGPWTNAELDRKGPSGAFRVC